VDLFLSDEKYIMAYYMNTRQRKSFRVNEELINLIENIDGERTLEELHQIMNERYGVDADLVDSVIQMMVNSRIITEVNRNTNILPKEDKERYARQINYFSEFLGSEEEGLMAQKKVLDTHLIVFGCGAIGGNIAIEMVMAGVREITLFDFDEVESSDVSRHMYFTHNSVGETKVNALKAQLEAIDDKVNVHVINRSMKPNDEIEDIIVGCDFVVNTLDEPYIGYTSSKISRICVKHRTPHFIAGGFDAHLASTGELIVPYVTPCVECYATHFKEKLKNWKPVKHPVKSRYTEIGGLASMSLFSSSFASIEIIKYLAGLLEMKDSFKVRGELLFTDMCLTYLNVKKNLECPVCGGEAIYESKA
jgi:molybdopterin/thiamine biosynthesis adenylyltransferase